MKNISLCSLPSSSEIGQTTVETPFRMLIQGSPMSLKPRLTALLSQAESDLPPGTFERLQSEAARLRASGMLLRAVKAGDTAPEFRLLDEQGVLVRLGSLLRAGPVVICFYRGQWCRFCALELEALSCISGEVTALGASLVAIAPEAHRREMPSMPFPLLADVGAKVAKRFGLAFTPTEECQGDYRALGRPGGADDRAPLPVPATYVVDPSGQVVFSQLNSDFTGRTEPADILVVLRGLRPTCVATSAVSAASNTPPAGRRL
jgi:peroxiredoxin